MHGVEFAFGLRAGGGDGGEGAVVEDDVGGDLAGLGFVGAEAAEAVDDGVVVVDGSGCLGGGAIGAVGAPGCGGAVSAVRAVSAVSTHTGRGGHQLGGGAEGGGGAAGHDLPAFGADLEQRVFAGGHAAEAVVDEELEQVGAAVGAEGAEQAEGAELHEGGVADAFGGGAGEHAGDFAEAEAAFGAGDAGEGFAEEQAFGFGGGFVAHAGGGALGVGGAAVAAGAGGVGHRFAEVGEHLQVAAAGVEDKGAHLFEFVQLGGAVGGGGFEVDAEGEDVVGGVGLGADGVGGGVGPGGSRSDEGAQRGVEALVAVVGQHGGELPGAGAVGAEVAEGLPELGDAAGVGVGLLDEELVDAGVDVVEEEQAVGGLAVAAGAADFLVVGFEGSGQVDVYDGAHVGAVDAHAKGVGGDGDAGFSAHEAVLGVAAGFVVHAAVVGDDGAGAEDAAHGLGVAFDALAGAGVEDDGAGSAGALGEEGGEAAGSVAVAGAEAGFEEEVVAEEAVDVDGGVVEGEGAGDVGADFGGGGGGAGEQAGGGELGDGFAEALVVGAEVVAPAADAVGFVDGKERDSGGGEGGEEGAVAEAFGGDVDEAEGAAGEAVEGVGLFVGGLAGVDVGGGDSAGGEGVDLVFHERDEGADDDGDAFEEQGGELVAEALAGAGGHDGHGGAAGEHVFDDVALARVEAGEAEVVGEGGVEGVCCQREGGGGGLDRGGHGGGSTSPAS